MLYGLIYLLLRLEDNASVRGQQSDSGSPGDEEAKIEADALARESSSR